MVHDRETNLCVPSEGHGWRRKRTEPDSPGIVGTSSGEKSYAMPTLSRLYDQRSIYGHSERQRRNRFQRVALSELWRHLRPRHCAPSPVGNERSCEIEAALVGSRTHAFRFVKKQKDCRVGSSNDPAQFFRRNDRTAEPSRHESHMIDHPHTQR